MKRFLHTFILLLAAHLASGQITISSYKAITAGSIDSCGVPTPAALSALPALGTPATNATWDLGSVAMQSSYVLYTYQAKTSGFSTATYSDSVSYTPGSLSAARYKAWRNVQQASTGVFIQGEEILTRQAKSIGSVTGIALDSFIIPMQVISYNASPLRIIKFPATMGSVWLDSAVRALNFNLTVTAASLNNAPGQQRQKRISLDSVVGWGSMRVPIVGKTKTTLIPVLQIHHFDITLDSFFVNGSPASATILSALGASQGQSTTVARTYFCRANATRPLIELVHSGSSHSSSASVFYIHQADLEEATGVLDVQAANSIRHFPNPISAGSTIRLLLPGSSTSELQYRVANTAGQIVAQGLLAAVPAPGITELRMPDGVSSGIYLLSLKQAGREITTMTVEVK